MPAAPDASGFRIAFMTGTAVENGLRRDWYIDERSDPEKATVAAAKYFGVLNKLFGHGVNLQPDSKPGLPCAIPRAVIHPFTSQTVS